eukprot:TRINITY_DN1596_c0_g1_i2.p2 TRINITY_DN1596_c0_g1~~TRINITY_DN1596_c0_g1_i2.p2  ORF type:complete len:320 (-),score=35.73 TRINITY_DN1596_c0_g1_i2:34-993(-)
MFSMVLIAMGFFLTVFFTQAKVGMIVSLIFFLLLYQIRQLVDNEDTNVAPEWKKNLASLSPHTAVSQALDNILMFEAEQVGVNFGNADQMYYNYRVSTCFYMLILNFFIFTIMGLYLDQVFPNEFGKKKHPLFFLSCLFPNKSKIVHQHEEKQQLNKENSQNIEAVSHKLQLQQQENKAILIKNLNKIYPNGKKAVQGLDLEMYEGQIFALLGHNGAGKTTTISMLTGLLEPSSGTVSICGKNIQTEMDEIRQSLGVCPQHDILFDDLTVEEHFNLYCAFKGVKAHQIKELVDKMIKDCLLYTSPSPRDRQKSRMPSSA